MGTSALLFSLAMMATAYGHRASQAGIPGSEMYDKYSGKKYEGNYRVARQMPDVSSFTNPQQITNNFSPEKFQSMAKPDAIMSAFSGGASGSPAPAESAAASEVKYRVARQMPDVSSFTNPSQITNNFSPEKFQSMAKPDAIMSAFSGGASGSPAPAESAAASEMKYRVARQMPDVSSFTNPSQITNNFSPEKFQSMAKPDAIMSAFSGGASGSPAPAESAAASEVKYRVARQMPDVSSFTNPSQITNNFSPEKFQSMAKPDAIMSAFSGGASGSPAPAESAAASEVKYRVARQMPDVSSFTNPQQITNNFSPEKFQSMAKPDAIMSAFSGGASGSPAPAESAAASEVKYRVARQMPDVSSFTNPQQITNNFSPEKFQSMAKPDAIMSAFSGGASGSPAPAESAAASEVKYRVARQMPDVSSFTNPQQITNNFSPEKFQSMAKPDAIMSAFSGGASGSPAPAESAAASEVKYRVARQMPDVSSFTNPQQITNNFSPEKFQSMAKPDAIMSAFSGGASGSPAPAESAAASEVKYRVARQMPDVSSFTNPQQITNNFSPEKFQSMAKPDAIMSAFSGGASGSPAPAESAAASEVKYRVARQMPDVSSFTNPQQITNNFSPEKFQSMAKPDAIMSAFSGGASGSPAPAESAAASEVKYRVARQMPDVSSFTNPSQITNNFSPEKFQSMAKPDAIMSAFSGGSGGGSSAAAAPGSSAPV